MLHLMLIQEVRDALRDVVKELEDNTKVAISCRRASLVPGCFSALLLNHRPLESMASWTCLQFPVSYHHCLSGLKQALGTTPCQSPTDSSHQDRQCQDDGPGPQLQLPASLALPADPDPASDFGQRYIPGYTIVSQFQHSKCSLLPKCPGCPTPWTYEDWPPPHSHRPVHRAAITGAQVDRLSSPVGSRPREATTLSCFLDARPSCSIPGYGKGRGCHGLSLKEIGSKPCASRKLALAPSTSPRAHSTVVLLESSPWADIIISQCPGICVGGG